MDFSMWITPWYPMGSFNRSPLLYGRYQFRSKSRSSCGLFGPFLGGNWTPFLCDRSLGPPGKQQLRSRTSMKKLDNILYTSNLQLSHPAFLWFSLRLFLQGADGPVASNTCGTGLWQRVFGDLTQASMATNDHHLKQRTNAANLLQKPAVVQPDQQMHRKELKRTRDWIG